MLYVAEKGKKYRKATSQELVTEALKVLEKQTIGQTLSTPNESKVYLRAQLAGLEHEVFCCLFLDNRHRVITFEKMFRGTINGTAVYAREIVKEALKHNAAAVILAHNHPSGIPEPSRADEMLTAKLKDALSLIDVSVIDHIIIGGDEHVSLAERGLM